VPVDFSDRVRILLVTTFEHVVPVGISRKELGNFIGGETLGLCKFYEIIVTVLTNLLPMLILLIAC